MDVRQKFESFAKPISSGYFQHFLGLPEVKYEIYQ